MSDPVSVAPAPAADPDLEARIQAAFEAALEAAEAGRAGARQLWNDYLALRAQRAPGLVKELDEANLQRARTAPRIPDA